MTYSTGNCSLFHHRYHIVWAPKYRSKSCTDRSACGCAISSSRSEPKWTSRSSAASCQPIMSTCSSKSRPRSLSATSCDVSMAARRAKSSTRSILLPFGQASSPEQVGQGLMVNPIALLDKAGGTSARPRTQEIQVGAARGGWLRSACPDPVAPR